MASSFPSRAFVLVWDLGKSGPWRGDKASRLKKQHLQALCRRPFPAKLRIRQSPAERGVKIERLVDAKIGQLYIEIQQINFEKMEHSRGGNRRSLGAVFGRGVWARCVGVVPSNRGEVSRMIRLIFQGRPLPKNS